MLAVRTDAARQDVVLNHNHNPESNYYYYYYYYYDSDTEDPCIGNHSVINVQLIRQNQIAHRTIGAAIVEQMGASDPPDFQKPFHIVKVHFAGGGR